MSILAGLLLTTAILVISTSAVDAAFDAPGSPVNVKGTKGTKVTKVAGKSFTADANQRSSAQILFTQVAVDPQLARGAVPDNAAFFNDVVVVT